MSVFSEICAALREGRRASLATIIRVAGPAPAPVHSVIAAFHDPEFETSGTVGGGCLDASVIRVLRGGAGPGFPFVKKFVLDDELGETAMTCGGTVEVLFEIISPDMLPVLEQLESRLREGEDSILVTRLEEKPREAKDAVGGMHGEGGRKRKYLLDAAGNIPADSAGGPLPFHIPGGDALPGPGDTVRRMEAGDDVYILEFLEAPPPLIVFGGGHVGKSVADFAAPSGFRVTVVDDRPEFAAPGRFPPGTRIVCRRFDLVWEELRLTDRTFVVIVTRGHKHDEMILEKCLAFRPRYIGMIGSRRKVALTFRNLQKGGMAPDRLGAVHAPIGLKIGARTPEEIGVSIVAEMIAVRRSPGGR